MRSRSIAALGMTMLAASLPAQGVTACFNPDSAWPAAKTFAIAPRCTSAWRDSLRATGREPQMISQMMLGLIADRPSLEALRAEYERTHSDQMIAPLMTAMAVNALPQDIAFLKSEVALPDTGMNWPRIQTAAVALGVMRARDMRDTLRALAARMPPNRFSGRAVAWAVSELDRPPCADSTNASGSALDRELLRIAMECRPPVLNPRSVYADEATGQVWHYSRDTWRLRARQASDTVYGKIAANVMVVPEHDVAFVQLGMHCGSLCGEGWTFRMRREGNVWRVVLATFEWVS